MDLFDNPLSPFALKVRVTLYEKGIEFEKHEVTAEEHRRELLKLNPRGEVPALRDGDAVIYDSRVICEYLEDKFPKPALLPSDPAGRARCRAVELISDTQIDACLYIVALTKMMRPDLGATFPGLDGQLRSTLRQHDANLEAALGERDYFGGTFSRADIALLPHLGAAAVLGYPIGAEFPRLKAWVERVNQRPSVQRATGEAMAAFGEQQKSASFFSNDRLHWRGDRIEAAIRFGLGAWLLDEIAADRGFLSAVP